MSKFISKPHVELLNFTKSRVNKAHVLDLSGKLLTYFRRNKGLRKKLKCSEIALTVVIIGRNKAKELNKKFRKKDFATDVLSFEQKGSRMGLGELVLCDSVVRRQAVEHKLSFTQEMDYLLIHGFLHLLGYDHEKSRRAELIMMRLQEKLFRRWRV